MPKISVCVPTYNNADTVERCITSILTQLGPSFELLIVDDHSTDGTVETIRGVAGDDSRLRLVVNPSNLGLVGNHNRCLELAHGELVKFVHADDWLLEGCLAHLSAPFEDPHIGLVYSPRRVDSRGNYLRWADKFSKLPDPYAQIGAGRLSGTDVVRCYVSRGAVDNWFGEPTAVMIRAKAVQDVGGMNRLMTQMVDMDLWLRIAAAYDVYRIPEVLSVRFHSGETASMANWHSDASWLDRPWLLYGLAQEPRLPAELRVRAATVLAVTVLRAGAGLLRRRQWSERGRALTQLASPRRARAYRSAVAVVADDA